MSSGRRKCVIFAIAAIAGLGVMRAATAGAAPILIEDGQSQTLPGGWNVGTQAGISLVITSASSTQIDIEKAANFTLPGGLFVTFTYDGAGTSPATTVDFTSEMIANNTGQSWSTFDFKLSNGATFPSVSQIFNPPGPTNGLFREVTLPSKQDASYFNGVQNTDEASSWSGPPSLEIDVAAGTDYFTLEELPNSGGSGSVVPMPAAVWQSLAGLAGLALFGIARKLKHRSA